MKFKTMVGQFKTTQHGLTMMIKASGALLYGDIVTMTGTTQDSTLGTLVGTKSAADSIALLGVVSELGGIADGALGEITVYGVADCNMASAAYTTPGAIVTTNGGGSGTGAIGTPAAGKVVGWTIGDVTGTVTQTKVFVTLSPR
jgi:hypothetical protein